MEYIADKYFPLDETTPTKPAYLQYYESKESGEMVLSFLNIFSKTIYKYNYSDSRLLSSISLNTTQLKSYNSIAAYYVKNIDSIYIIDDVKQKVLLVNSRADVMDSVSLIRDHNAHLFAWTFKFPQLNLNGAAPILFKDGKLIITGLYPWAIPDTLIHNFNLTSVLDFNNKNLNQINKYPPELFGSDFDWDDPMFTATYTDLGKGPNDLIISFPISHDLYISDLKSGLMRKVYGGSPEAKSITSIGKKISGDQMFKEKLNSNIIHNDLYGAIKYDKYRDMFYRFVRKAVPENSKEKTWKNKSLSIIMMDSNFKFLGETVIGTLKSWNWENSFVTKQGLLIEYVDNKTNDEKNLSFKIFKPKKI